MSSLLTLTAPPLRTTKKRIIRPGTNIPGRLWNMPTKLHNGRKKRIGSPQNPRGSHNCALTTSKAERALKRADMIFLANLAS
jgi:hypothetical protein